MKKLYDHAVKQIDADMNTVDQIFNILMAIGTKEEKKINVKKKEVKKLIRDANLQMKTTIAKLSAAELTLLELGKFDKYNKTYNKLIKERECQTTTTDVQNAEQ
jgi:hypothetical protein